MAALSTLPNELLSLVTNYLDRPRDVLHLSLASRRLNDFTRLDGWKAFLKGRFGLSGPDADARDTIHGLTTLYRNWDRRAFLARYLEPTEKTTSLNSWERKRWRGPQGQTMGYQPSIDSYEEMLGSWADRREVLAWSAGTHLVMRLKDTTSKAKKVWEEDHEDDAFDDFKHAVSWYTYQIPGGREGRDDIMALNLLRPHQKGDGKECIAFGNAFGDLTMLQADLEHQEMVTQFYDTGRRGVGSLSISSDPKPLMVATLGETSLALYPIDLDHSPDEEILPLSQVDPIVFGARDGRLWSCDFVSNNTVAVGLGPTFEPIHVYEVTPSGFNPSPLRKFSLDSKFCTGTRNDTTARTNTSVYPILPISPDSQAGSDAGHTFLSGGYDGIVRLHDMRSSHGFETMFWDVTNDSSIYSLAAQGLERIVAGTSMHSMLKVFDLRFSGSHAYHTLPLPSTKNHTSQPHQRAKTADYAANKIVSEAVSNTGTTPVSGGWNLFLHPRNQPRRRTLAFRPPRSEHSPVYALSIPSSTSPSLYAGVEGAVISLTFASITDTHPDPLFLPSITRFPDTGLIDIKGSYNPNDNVLNLGMYEQGNEQALGMQLMVQEGVGSGLRANAEKRDLARFRGLDERWRDPSDDRWSRGEEPQVRRGGTGRGGRGRGRGRGRGW